MSPPCAVDYAHEEVSYLVAVQRVAQHAYISGMFKGLPACSRS
jgi:hypothetical protein